MAVQISESEWSVALEAFNPDRNILVADDELEWLTKAFVAYLRARRDPQAIAALVPALAQMFDKDIREHVALTRDVARNEPDGDGWAIEALPLVERVAAWAFPG